TATATGSKSPSESTTLQFVVKGGSYASDPADLRTDARQPWSADQAAAHLGFRCALTLPGPAPAD
ncbi:MAG: SUMF1/EgtB/PvdO family nonheme iron enzyme, partial [Caldilineaceae bacterium]|nr:SUMF1/EgtB/PvdO family nonheme iron enzyme [Caldilineaceae bacterium]